MTIDQKRAALAKKYNQAFVDRMKDKQVHVIYARLLDKKQI